MTICHFKKTLVWRFNTCLYARILYLLNIKKYYLLIYSAKISPVDGFPILDEEVILQDTEDTEEMRDFIYEAWSEFNEVASQLLQRIEKHQSEFEPLDQPS